MPPELPPPEDRPDADVVLYDGRCAFCKARVAQLRWFDRDEALTYLSLHEPTVAERFPGVSLERLLEEMCVVTQSGDEHWGADAVRYLSRRLPRLRWLSPVMHLPGAMPLWRWLYRLVARNRYLLGVHVEDCEDGACAVRR